MKPFGAQHSYEEYISAKQDFDRSVDYGFEEEVPCGHSSNCNEVAVGNSNTCSEYHHQEEEEDHDDYEHTNNYNYSDVNVAHVENVEDKMVVDQRGDSILLQFNNNMRAVVNNSPSRCGSINTISGVVVNDSNSNSSSNNSTNNNLPEAVKPQQTREPPRSSMRRALPKSITRASSTTNTTAASAETSTSSTGGEKMDEEANNAMQSAASNNNKIPWTKEEDESLINLVKKHGKMDWFRISAEIPSRNRKQCRDRYTNHLETGVKKGDWTPEEDSLIFELQKKLGNKWAIIASKMPNRTDNAIKNRFWSHKRALQRKAKKEKTIADLKEASRKVDDMPDLHDLPDFKVEETTSMTMHQPPQHPANHQNNKRQKRDVVTIDLGESLHSTTSESATTNVVSMQQILIQHRAERESHNSVLAHQSDPAGPSFLRRDSSGGDFEDEAIFHPYQDFSGPTNASHAMEKMPGGMGEVESDDVYY
mmetsp:Transcript_15097/g.23438  ORF Transcript_15097/g.23438 Transcript_15097/m.23438 type:complete len:478 (+) Transcript_15097:360-1793(+)|eukprot:CAMPEP_0196802502 /NCGR_PEP_ID=MMETSP1362-20130617/2107_1 /TAXON_ID=163516 /ORGANISM="Leptocylindrus danicus, Strain CCMP1856" /LENGTH=477 /DNA_ID=CAMNT_0042173821 /DNA_START=312 /DNA_END=1745 /DNA_ORIENTATION=+